MRRKHAMRWTILGLLCGLALAAPAPAFQPREVSLEDLTLLAKSDLSAETTLVFLDRREIGFELDPAAIALLREQGVSEEVIRYLLERTNRRVEPVDRVVYVSTGYFPSHYYGFYYGYNAFPYYGNRIPGHWTHGYHWAGNHYVGGHHSGRSFGHGASLGHGVHASNDHGAGGHDSPGHSLGHSGSHSSVGHDTKSHSTSNRSSHVGARHSGRGHGNGRHGRSAGHQRGGGGRHGGGHRGGGGH